LIGREQVDVGAERLDIRQAVRRRGDAVDDRDRAGGARLGGDLGHRVDLADDVGGVGEGDDAGLFRQQVIEPRRVEVPGLRIDPPFAHHDAGFGQAPPDAGIGLVILVGDDDLVARGHQRAEGAGQDIGVLAGRGAEMHRFRLDPEPGGEALVALVHPRPGPARGRIGSVGLHLGLEVELVQPAHHRPGRVGAAGVLEEGPALQRRLGEGRELASDIVEVELGHGGLRADRGRVGFKPTLRAVRR